MLSDSHRRELESSGLIPDTIAKAGIYTATQEQVKEILGFNAGPGLAIPYRSLNGKGEFTAQAGEAASAEILEKVRDHLGIATARHAVSSGLEVGDRKAEAHVCLAKSA